MTFLIDFYVFLIEQLLKTFWDDHELQGYYIRDE